MLERQGVADPAELSGVAAARRVRADRQGARAAADHPRDAEVRPRVDRHRAARAAPGARADDGAPQLMIAILGAGRLGESLVRGFLSSGWRAPTSSPSPAAAPSGSPSCARTLRRRRRACDNAAAVTGAGLVIVSVKPQDMEVVLAEIAPAAHRRADAALGRRGRDDRVHRGASAARARGSCARCRTRRRSSTRGSPASRRAAAREEDLALAAEALGHLGAVVRVAEHDMDAVTALSGSGPAYFALLAEAMIEAGLLLGLSRDISTQLVVQTMFGSALLLRDEKMHPVELRESGHLAGRHDDAGDPRARALRRARGVPERDQRRDRALAPAGAAGLTSAYAAPLQPAAAAGAAVFRRRSPRRRSARGAGQPVEGNASGGAGGERRGRRCR